MKLNFFLSNFLVVSSLLFITACGSDNSSSSNSKSLQNQVADKQDDQGLYRGILLPVNPDYAGEPSGTVEIKIQGDDVLAESNLSNARPGVKYLQNILVGTECPTKTADANEDSVIDINEAFQVSGKVFLPLDADLSEQLSGMDFGPIANTSGHYIYKRSTTLSELLSDLRMPDPDALDYVVKLLPENELNLEGKVILISGLSEETALPESVSGVGTLSTYQSFPVACGKIIRVKDEESIESSRL